LERDRRNANSAGFLRYFGMEKNEKGLGSAILHIKMHFFVLPKITEKIPFHENSPIHNKNVCSLTSLEMLREMALNHR